MVSIIIPIGKEEYLERAISSAVEQSYEKKEIILVDDRKDRSFDLVKYTSEMEGEIRIYDAGGGAGASKARNIGLDRAAGEYIQFLDSDDWMEKDKIQKQINGLLSTQWGEIVMPATQWCLIYKNHTKVIQIPERMTPAEYIEMLMVGGFLPPCAWLFESRLLSKSGWWDERLTKNDDGEFVTRYMCQIDKIVVYDSYVYYNRDVEKSLNNELTKNAFYSEVLALDKIKSYWDLVDPVASKDPADKRLILYAIRYSSYLGVWPIKLLWDRGLSVSGVLKTKKRWIRNEVIAIVYLLMRSLYIRITTKRLFGGKMSGYE